MRFFQKFLLLACILIGKSLPILSSSSEVYEQTKSWAEKQNNQVASIAKSANPKHIPGFETDKPKTASLDESTIGDAALEEAKSNKTAKHLTFQAKERQTFTIDPKTDPLFTAGNEVVAAPQKMLNEKIKKTFKETEVSEITKVCEEGGKEFYKKCSKHLKIVLKIIPATSKTVYSCPGHKERKGWSLHYSHWTCAGCQSSTVTTPKKVEVASETWIDGCKALEKQVEEGLCRYVDFTTSEKNETRIIQGEPITRDHFEEYYQYGCYKGSSKSCAGLREQGCYQSSSKCKQKKDDRCVLWEQTYKCPSGKKSLKVYGGSNSENPFCLTGDCADTSYEINKDMMNAMSHLYVLQKIQKDMTDLKVFKGDLRWCTRNCLNFRDCCGPEKEGWGVSVGLTDCDKAELELRKLRDKNLCVQVGTYCAERDKVFKTCLRKKTTFCCYGTKVARLIQEHGRSQLKMGWGSAKDPDCKGFSPEQLRQIDFSQIDFSELFQEIKEKMVAKDQKQSLGQISSERLQKNMTLLTNPSQKSSKKQLKKMRKEGF